jgi:hypothetical protein
LVRSIITSSFTFSSSRVSFSRWEIRDDDDDDDDNGGGDSDDDNDFVCTCDARDASLDFISLCAASIWIVLAMRWSSERHFSRVSSLKIQNVNTSPLHHRQHRIVSHHLQTLLLLHKGLHLLPLSFLHRLLLQIICYIYLYLCLEHLQVLLELVILSLIAEERVFGVGLNHGKRGERSLERCSHLHLLLQLPLQVFELLYDPINVIKERTGN